jgi:putative flippase GtrA
MLGIVGTAVHYSILLLLVQLFFTSPVIASTIGFAGGAITNYFLNYYLYRLKTAPEYKSLHPHFTSFQAHGIIFSPPPAPTMPVAYRV